MDEQKSRRPVVLLASESPDYRRAWRRHLRGSRRLSEAPSRAALERTLALSKPDILLLDQQMLAPRGVPQLAALLRLSPATRVIVLAATITPRDQVAALKMGARGCCHAASPGSLLRKAVLSVHRGEIWVARNVIPDLLKEVLALADMRARAVSATDDRFARLTRSERLIAHLIGSGASNKEIANELSVTEKTVKAHLTAIFRKLGVTDRLRLAILITQQNRLSLDHLMPREDVHTATG
jgi:DNA-binding NarL/FixJ family response regulator